MVKNKLNLVGTMNARLFDKDGNLKRSIEKKNLIVSLGKDGIMDQLLESPSIDKPSHLAIGEGTTEPELTDTALENQSGTRKTVSKERNLNEVEFYAVFGPDEPVDSTIEITEAGIFNASTDGELYSRITFGVVTKEPEDTFDITWTWELKND